MTTGEKIRNIRIEKNLTQKQLGDLCGMADSAIRRYEIGNGQPKLATLQKIADALQVDLLLLLPDETIEKMKLVPNEDKVVVFDDQIYVAKWSATDPSVKERYLRRVTPDNIKAISAYIEKTLNPCDDYDRESVCRLIDCYVQLNVGGKHKAVERVEELTEIPKYKKKPPQE